ncbi:hypothetical protein [Umezawaea sp. Da 62-37]|uniref:hypothetical protein n=1 Tax=Umezawaea sp. Da 62-37 TaxID=3075927 RepID=UPI0028F6F9B5|nr:hypothetical protein [Umezawaea sp. Da 62-37]WNV83163.1 hypothetical protein RM788_33935 [Umezawaea sp. Da 62-37]
MSSAPAPTRSRKQARPSLTAIVVIAVVLIGGVVALMLARQTTAPEPAVAAPTISVPPQATSSAIETAGTTAEHALATRPMMQLPAQAAQPQAMTTASAGPAITVLTPTISPGRWIPDGFPSTPEGALGQLKTLNETVLTAADPQVYARGFQELAEPGAPDPTSTGLSTLLTGLRSRAQLPATGPIPGLSATYRVTHGQIKGATSDGLYVVACVLGQFSAGANGRLVSAGVGDCQAMRWNGTRWLIASGSVAAPAPCAWPGSADAVKAGYRELNGG